jgi:hypothetical protein
MASMKSWSSGIHISARRIPFRRDGFGVVAAAARHARV